MEGENTEIGLENESEPANAKVIALKPDIGRAPGGSFQHSSPRGPTGCEGSQENLDRLQALYDQINRQWNRKVTRR